MTDQAHDCQASGHLESQTPDTVQVTGCQLSSLPDPCTSAQLAAVLGKSPKTLVDWCQEREFTHIPCFRLGNRWYHRVADLVRWLNGIERGRIDFHRRPRHTNGRTASARNRR